MKGVDIRFSQRLYKQVVILQKKTISVHKVPLSEVLWEKHICLQTDICFAEIRGNKRLCLGKSAKIIAKLVDQIDFLDNKHPCNGEEIFF